MTDSITIAGFHYLANQTVTAFIGGLDCGDYVVDETGQITVPTGADPDGFFGPGYLASISDPGGYGDLEVRIVITDDTGSMVVAVPMVVGIAYTSQGQLLRPFVADEIKSSTGPALAKRRRAHMYGMLLRNSTGISIGTDFRHLLPMTLRAEDGSALPISATFDGVVWDTLTDDYTFDTQMAWEVSRPYPTTVVQAGLFLNSEDE